MSVQEFFAAAGVTWVDFATLKFAFLRLIEGLSGEGGVAEGGARFGFASLRKSVKDEKDRKGHLESTKN